MLNRFTLCLLFKQQRVIIYIKIVFYLYAPPVNCQGCIVIYGQDTKDHEKEVICLVRVSLTY